MPLVKPQRGIVEPHRQPQGQPCLFRVGLHLPEQLGTQAVVTKTRKQGNIDQPQLAKGAIDQQSSGKLLLNQHEPVFAARKLRGVACGLRAKLHQKQLLQGLWGQLQRRELGLVHFAVKGFQERYVAGTCGQKLKIHDSPM